MTQQINLFNSAFLKQKKIFTSRNMASSLALLLVATLALVWYGRYHTNQLQLEADRGAAMLEKKKAQQALAIKEFPATGKDGALEGMISVAQAEQALVRELIDVLEGGQAGNVYGYSPYFAALARQSMGELWLTGVAIEGAGKQIELRGRAMEADQVPGFIARLTREPVLQGKEFNALSISRPTVSLVNGKDAPASVELAPYIDFHLQTGTRVGGETRSSQQAATVPTPPSVPGLPELAGDLKANK